MSIKLIIKSQQVMYNQHYMLDGLDAADQHPIESIINLRDELDKRYIIPQGGIPASDLAEQYISIDNLHATETRLLALYAECRIGIDDNIANININKNDIDINKDDITNLSILINQLDNKISSIPGIDSAIFNGSTSIKQENFTATDASKIFEAIIYDTDKRVIEPTVLKAGGELAIAGDDYVVSYPDDTTLRIEFTNNGTYLINYVTGELSDTEFDILLQYLKDLEKNITAKISGSVIKPQHNVDIIYDNSGKVIKEIYSGNINKIVTYEYNTNDDISKKTIVQNNIIKSAHYVYNSKGELIRVEDEGTDIPVDGTRAPQFTLNIEYDNKGFISKEIYSGDKNTIIEYSRNSFGDITEKTITDNGETKRARYIYDSNRKLISIEDDGTESVAIVFPSNCNCNQGSAGGSVSSDQDITNAEIDLIFNTIFID